MVHVLFHLPLKDVTDYVIRYAPVKGISASGVYVASRNRDSYTTVDSSPDLSNHANYDTISALVHLNKNNYLFMVMTIKKDK